MIDLGFDAVIGRRRLVAIAKPGKIGKDDPEIALQLAGDIQQGAAIHTHPVNQNQRLTLPRFPIGDAEFRARLSENPMT